MVSCRFVIDQERDAIRLNAPLRRGFSGEAAVCGSLEGLQECAGFACQGADRSGAPDHDAAAMRLAPITS
jgi:hypothetical protein